MALVLFWLVEMPLERGQPQTVLTTAHDLALASGLFQQLAPVLETHFDAKAKWSFGRNELAMPDGSKWLVRASTPSAGHGLSLDLIIADELWAISEDVVEHGLLPAQRARKAPLFSAWSTAGDQSSILMQRWREEGLRNCASGDHGAFYFAEYSPDPLADLNEPAAWMSANPAIGHTIELETLLVESKKENHNAFLRSALNLWVSSDRAWIDARTWKMAEHLDPVDAPPAVLVFDSAWKGERFAGVIARRIPGTDPIAVRLETAFVCRTESELWHHVLELSAGNECRIATTPGLDGRMPDLLKPRSVTVGEREMRQWTVLVGSMIHSGRVTHNADQMLTEHMTRAVCSTSGAGLTLSSPASPGPIELARCAIWAAALATAPSRSGRPMVFTAST